jgi:peptidoglycan/xylan/chitin deacetylase (PgdA/CDA1 family)
MSEVLVLCYHAVSDDWPDSLAVTPAQLRAQLEWVVKRGFRGATFSDAMTAPPARRTVAVTFDDAYVSVSDLAYPILSELGLPGTVYTVSEFSDGKRLLHWPGIEQWHGGPHEHELRCMNWGQLAVLGDAGWEIGSHTCSHPYLTELADDDLGRELLDSRLACEVALGRPCRSIAYPYGDVDERVITATSTAGYEAAGGLPKLTVGSDPLNWPRVGIYRIDTLRRFQLKVTPSVRRLQHTLKSVQTRIGR